MVRLRSTPPFRCGPIVVASLCMGVAALACDGTASEAEAGDDVDGSICGPTTATVVRVIDGDTVELDSGERVRYLLVDTPEITGGKDECYGTEAADFNRQTVEGKEVHLRYDEADCDDTYDRLLAFVSIQGREINALIVERGFGRVLFIPPAGATEHPQYQALQAAAQDGRAGLWGACADD